MLDIRLPRFHTVVTSGLLLLLCDVKLRLWAVEIADVVPSPHLTLVTLYAIQQRSHAFIEHAVGL